MQLITAVTYITVSYFVPFLCACSTVYFILCAIPQNTNNVTSCILIPTHTFLISFSFHSHSHSHSYSYSNSSCYSCYSVQNTPSNPLLGVYLTACCYAIRKVSACLSHERRSPTDPELALFLLSEDYVQPKQGQQLKQGYTAIRLRWRDRKAWQESEARKRNRKEMPEREARTARESAVECRGM